MDKIAMASLLQPLLREPVQSDVSMKRYTSWKIGGPADILITPANEQELAAALLLLYTENIPCLVIGKGTNILVADRGIRGVVIHISDAMSHSLWRGETVEAGAGMLLAALALEAAERSLSGLEFARGIPGSVGGGVRMNAGAYGSSLSDSVTFVEAVGYDGKAIRLLRQEIRFDYRDTSLFELDAVVTKVGFKLKPGDRDTIMAQMKTYSARRSFAQPLEYPSCGSVFRNPEGDHAGHLIEMAGLRGTAIGGVEVSKKHGNFIINHGNGTAADVRELIALVQERVYTFAGVELTPEVKFAGDF